jgi:hypothetical protein
MSDRNLAEVGGFAAGPVLAGVATRLVMRARGQTTTNTPTEELMKQALVVQLAVAGLALFTMEQLGKGHLLGAFAHGSLWGSGVSAGLVTVGLATESFKEQPLSPAPVAYEMAAGPSSTPSPSARALSPAQRSQFSALAKLLTGGRET